MVSILAASLTALAVGGLMMLYLRSGRSRMRKRRPSPAVEGLDVTARQFWMAVLAVAFATFLLVHSLTGLTVVSIVPALVVASLPKAYFAQKRAKRVAEVQESWPDGLRDLLSSIRSGASLPTAVEDLARSGPTPLQEAFQGYGVYARSLGVVTALEMVKEDLADPTSDRVIEVLILAYERGGNVVTQILEDLAEATTRDLWAMEQVRSENLEQKINARIVFVLPWLVLVVMTSRSGAFREFYSTPIGIAVAVAGGVLSLLGILIASKLGAIPSEPRVFAGSR
jgi:tight adherence protein B